MNAINATATSPDSAHPEPTQIHPMSDYEKFLFDLKGFLVIPNVLTDEEIRAKFDALAEGVSDERRDRIWKSATRLASYKRIAGFSRLCAVDA